MDQEKCHSCSHPLEFNSNFCPECGTNLQKAKPKRTNLPKVEIPPPPTTGITIEFLFSMSPTYDAAVKEAAQQPRFTRFGEGKKAMNRVTYDNDNILALLNLVDHLAGWRHRTVYVDGQNVTWNSVFPFVWCYKRRTSSLKPQHYCYGYENDFEFNIWGCLRSGMPFREYAQWFCWGHFVDDNGTWKFDKEQILQEFQKKLYHYRFCPALDLPLMAEMLVAFPNTANPEHDRNWQFIERLGNGDSPNLVITTIRLADTHPNTLKGVSPRGRGAIQDIGKRLRRKLPWE